MHDNVLFTVANLFFRSDCEREEDKMYPKKKIVIWKENCVVLPLLVLSSGQSSECPEHNFFHSFSLSKKKIHFSPFKLST